MNRDTLVTKLVGLGLPKEFVDSLSDEQLSQAVSAMEGLLSGAPANPSPVPAGAGSTNMSDDDDASDMPPDTSLMSDPAMPGNQPTMCSDPPAGPSPTPIVGVPKLDQAGNQPSQIIVKYSELSRRLDSLAKKHQALDRLTAQRTATEKTKLVHSFCERLVKAGKLYPWEIDGTGGHATLLDRLMRADHSRVMKFSEKGKTIERTELDRQMDELEARPVVHKFGEKMAQPLAETQRMSADKRAAALGSSPLGKAVLAAERTPAKQTA